MENVVFITGGSGFIGTNLIELLISEGYSNIVNFDKAPPTKSDQTKFWVEGDIMKLDALTREIEKAQPAFVIHLAARTDTLSDVLHDYDENITGTANLLSGVSKCSSVKHAIITSTQYVYKSDDVIFPTNDEDFKPHTIYGQSKVMTEKLTREANLNCLWTIVRPTNIWGPWHMRYPTELWKVLDKGIYFHPVQHEVIRTYGYVKNITHQMFKIMNAPKEDIDRKVFYVGDKPVDSYVWLNELSLQLTGKKIKRLPKLIFQTVALGGDLLRAIKIPFPLYSKRFKNMIEDYPAPTHITVEKFGVAEEEMTKNVAETVSWLKNEGKLYFEYWKNK